MSLIPLSIFGLDCLKLLSIKSSLCILNTDLLLLYDWKYILSVCGLCFQPLHREVCRTLLWTAETVNTSLAGKKKKNHNTRSVLLVSRGSYILTLFKFTPLCSALHPLTFSCKQCIYCFNSSELTYVLWQVALRFTMWIWLYMSLPY